MIIYRSKIKDIIFEFLPPVGKSRGVILVCDGLPGSPRNPDLLKKISELGFFAVYPRYTGTWESGGEFLSPSPTNNIIQIIDFIKEKELIELYSGKKFDCRNLPIYLLGSSFGGSVALALSNNKKVRKIIAFSPVVNFKDHNNDNKEQDLLWLMDFIRKAFGRAYYFKVSNWKKMIKGQIFNPPSKVEPSRSDDILIFYDQEDPSIDWHKVKSYAELNKIKAVVSKNLGHLSFSKITSNHWKIIDEWVK